MRLYEFAPSGNSGSGPYAYYQSALDFAQQYVEQWSADDGINGNDDNRDADVEDAEELENTANAFLKGMDHGVATFNKMDTFLRDELANHWSSDGLNVEEDIYKHKSNSAQKPAAVETDKYKKLITKDIQNRISLLKSSIPAIQSDIDSGELEEEYLASHLKIINILEQLLSKFNQGTEVGLSTLLYLHNHLDRDGYDDAYTNIINILKDNNITFLFPPGFKNI